MEMAVIMLRLDKYLADMQVGTRSEVKQMIRKGLVTVDGLIVKKPEEKVDCEKQVVVCSGAIVSYHQYEYYIHNRREKNVLRKPLFRYYRTFLSESHIFLLFVHKTVNCISSTNGEFFLLVLEKPEHGNHTIHQPSISPSLFSFVPSHADL